jgi:hypothetical protein
MLAESMPQSDLAPTRGAAAERVLLLLFGGLAVLMGAAMLVGGAGMTWVDETKRDDAGYLNTSTGQFVTSSFALTSDPFEVHFGNSRKWVSDEDFFGRIRLQVESADRDVGVFLGVGSTSDVERYLADVELDRVSGLDADPFRPTYIHRAGRTAPALPGDQSFWVASASGRGGQTITWRAKTGSWSVVAMNVDGSRGVDVRVRAGAELGLLNWLGPALLGGGMLLFLVGVAMIFGVRRQARGPSTAQS